MPTNIELAIGSVLCKHKALTVHNVLVDYLRLLGYIAPGEKEATVPHDAVVAFEHALDKEPLLRAPGAGLRARMYAEESTALREAYWREKLGAPAPVRCTCPTCGCTVAYEQEDDGGGSGSLRRKGGRRRGKRCRAAKRLREPACAHVPLDPYGPSTSALVM